MSNNVKNILDLIKAGGWSLGRGPWPRSALGLSMWVTLGESAGQRGFTDPKVPEENKQEHLTLKKEKYIYTTRTSMKAIVSWKKLTSVSDLPGLKHTAQSPRWHRKRGREHVAGAQTRETEVLAYRRPASQLAACKGFQRVGCHL